MKKFKEFIVENDIIRVSDSLKIVLLQHLSEFKNEACRRAEASYIYRIRQLEEAGWDLNVAAPMPHGRMGAMAYRLAKEKRTSLETITTYVNHSVRHGDPSLRKESPEKRASYIASAIQGAHDDYMAWVVKVAGKIGKPVDEAKMVGDPWKHSLITVKCNDGEEQVWRTQMIINQSKYGKLFNQFPTRKSK